jgi:ArsR family transcriptional regulator
MSSTRHRGAAVMGLSDRLPNDTVERLALLFKAFADSTRLRVLHALVRGERSVGAIADEVGISRSAVSHQLSFLRTMRLIKGRRAGRAVYYSLDDDHVRALLRQGLEHVLHE